MVDLQKQNISVTPGSLQIEMSGGYITAISGKPIAGGSGGGTQTEKYYGDNINVQIDYDSNTISLTPNTTALIYRDIPTKVSDLTDSASYALKTEIPDSISAFDDTDEIIYSYLYPLTADIQSQLNFKQNKLQFDLNAKGEISAIGPLNQTTALAGANGITGDYYSASNPSGFITPTTLEPILQDKHYVTSSNEIIQGSAQYGLTTAGWTVIQGAGGGTGITEVSHDTTLTGNGNSQALGVNFNHVQPKGNYVSSTDISDMATKTWVGEQGFYTKASGDNDYAPKSVTSTINTLTAASAGWNEVTAKLGTAQYATDSATFVTSSNSTITGTKQYALTTAGWAEVQVGASLTASSGINIDNNLINVTLGRNLKFDTYSSVTTEDDLSATSYRAGKYDNQYTIVNKYGLETYFSSAPDSAKLTLSTNGLNNTLEGGNRSITANYDLNHLFFKSYDNTGTYSGNYSQVEVKVMQETAPEETQHRSSITLTDYYGGVEHTGLITVEKIAQWDQGGGTSFTGVTTAGSISGDGLTNPLGLKTSAEQALTSVSNKVDKPDTTQTVLNNNYLIYSTLTGAGTTTGWMPLSANYYSKSETNGTFVATANIDTTTLSGDGKSVSTKLGVKTDVIATRDYVNSSFLPTSGGTVSGQLVISGGSTFDSENLKFIRTGQNGYGRIGLASNGALAVKVDDSNSNTTQINVAANASYNELIQVQHGGTTAYLIPAVTANTTAGLTNDGILHIILES